MNITEFDRTIRTKFPPFANNKKSGNIQAITKEYLDEFYALVERLDDDELDESRNRLLRNLNSQNETIMKAIEHYLAGSIIDYYLTIYDFYFNPKFERKDIAYCKWPKRQPFFRMRVNQPNKKFKNFEMFHIPFEDVHKTGNQRFSLSGHPALYLGSSTFICWEELSNPAFENCNFSVLANERELNVFDLRPPQTLTLVDIQRFPLIIASSIRLNERSSTFKSEYIIPQAVYFALIRFNDIDVKKYPNTVRFDGIVYFSSHISDELLFGDPNLLVNFVFPVKKVCDTGYCEDLKQLFQISESKSVNDLWLRFPQLFVTGNSVPYDVHGYEWSIFRTLEKYICGRTVLKSKIL